MHQANIVRDCEESATVGTAFEVAFSRLRIMGNRNEYVYRSAVAQKILLGIAVPDVPNTQRYTVLRALFAELKPVDVHREMVKTLKHSRSLVPLTEFVSRLPDSLKAAGLSIPVRRGDRDRVPLG